MSRPSWNDFYLSLAAFVAQRSRDPSTKVGAVIVRPDNTIASLGYNDFCRGVTHTPARYADRDWKLAATVHAESNAILNAREPLAGYRMLVTFHPCAQCAAQIVQSGISHVVIPDHAIPERWEQNMLTAAAILREGGVTLWRNKP